MTEITRSKLSKILEQSTFIKNLSRRKWFILMLFALIECRNICFNEISLHIKSNNKTASNLRRIQRFFAAVTFDENLVARFLLSLLPSDKLTLCIDRTYWQIGNFSCNILLLSVYFNGIGLPLYWKLLPKQRGNSNKTERIDLVQKCIDLVGVARIAYLIGDREFIGFHWFEWLKQHKIPFCIRLPKSHWIKHNGKLFKVGDLVQNKQEEVFYIVEVEGVVCNLFCKKIPNGDYLLLAGTGRAEEFGELYRHRWSIEVCFKAFKSYGFQLENTHLKEPEKIEKLLVLVSLALSLCVNLGFLLHKEKKEIKVKKHGYKANSFFRVGLESWRKFFKEQEVELLKYIDLFLEKWENSLKKIRLPTDNQEVKKNVV